MFDTDTSKWSSLNVVKEKDMYEPPERRNHVAALYNDMMIVYGGLNDQSILNDVSALDLVKKKWIPIYTTPHKDHGFGLKTLPAIYRAKGVMVLHHQRRT